MLKSWNKLPDCLKTEAVKVYYLSLVKKQKTLQIKRMVDFVCAVCLLFPLLPVMGILALWIKVDSHGPVFYRQERITRYGKPYRIFKFRTMITDADKKGPTVTPSNDSRITKAGKKLRKLRLDELPQLFNVLTGDMTFVGARPEVKRYVDAYTDEMWATLLLPAGITSIASIAFKDEDKIIERYQLKSGKTLDEIYVEQILPIKMKYNLSYIRKMSIWNDIKIMIQTVAAVIKR